jgi:hypothetical protein
MDCIATQGSQSKGGKYDEDKSIPVLDPIALVSVSGQIAVFLCAMDVGSGNC